MLPQKELERVADAHERSEASASPNLLIPIDDQMPLTFKALLLLSVANDLTLLYSTAMDEVYMMADELLQIGKNRPLTKFSLHMGNRG